MRCLWCAAEALGYPSDATLYALQGTTGEVLKPNGTLPIKALTSSQSQLLTVAPDSGYGYALLGEQGMWLSVSSQRFSDLVYGHWGTCVAVTGRVPGSGKEGVTVRWMTPYGLRTSECSVALGDTVYAFVVHRECKLIASGWCRLSKGNIFHLSYVLLKVIML